MPSSLTTLVNTRPSGRSRALLLDAHDYGVRVVRQGAPVPWLDLAALTGYAGQLTSLLKTDALWVDVADLYAAHLDARPELRTAMGAKRRTGYPLRTLLGDEATVQAVATTLRTLAESSRRPLVLDLPSPGRWLAEAHTAAGSALESVDADAADSASMYVAEWLGRLGDLAVALVLLDADRSAGDTSVDPESLGEYTSITNVAGHHGWTVGLLDADGLSLVDPDGRTADEVGLLPEEFWSAQPAPDAGAVLLGRVPADASPETVLSRLEELG